MSVRSLKVLSADAGERLDRLVARKLDLSRSVVQRLISGGALCLNGEETSPSHKVRVGDEIEVQVLQENLGAEDIIVPVVFEDEHLVVVNKPAGLVVHPGAGNLSGTLVNALLERGISGGEDPQRPGIVHRLDRDTSGLMMVAKGEPAYSDLVRQLSERRVRRVYRAIVVGEGLPPTGTVDSPVGRNPSNPTLMAAGIGKQAITHFAVLSKSERHAMLRVRLETGRTHQIRVHLSAIGYPVYADPLYGTAVPGQRLWLHAEQLEFTHPVTGEPLRFETKIPDDLRESARELDASFDLW